ncbi:MAG: DNA translocase FtsK [Flavobacteriales bacterium]|nr:DNA translocase FtsK [Flavobacteriales bacterium]
MVAKSNKTKKSSESEKKAAEKSGGIKSLVRNGLTFSRDARVRKIAGAFLAISSIFLALSFLSYMFTGHIDLRLIESDAATIEGQEHFKNIMGKAGAHVAWFFMNQYFGIAAILIPFISFLWGVKLWFGKKLLPFGKSIRLSFIGLFFIPLFLGFFIHRQVEGFDQTLQIVSNENLVGGYGHVATEWCIFTLGRFGTLLFIVFVLGATVMFNFERPLQWLQSWIKSFFSSEEDDEHTTQDTADDDKPSPRNETRTRNVPVMDEDTSAPSIDVADDVLDELIGGSASEEEELPELTIDKRVEVPQDESSEEEDAQELEINETPPPSSIEQDESDDDLGMEISEGEEEEQLSEEEIDEKVQEFGEYDPKLDLSRFELPSIDLLEKHGSGELSINKEELENNKNRIVETLNNYNIQISKIKATIGPTVTLYEIVPAPGVRISKIKNLEDDIALSLSALGIRIIAPIPGKGTIGIEVPNSTPSVVSVRSLIATDKFQNTNYDLPVVLGKTIANETFIADLAKMPHLLMAGATGQGKSVGLNEILVSLLYKKHPSQLKFVLVDPKKVELTLFNKIERHYLAKLPDEEEAIITDTHKVVKTLNSLCIEMDDRYELLKNAHCRNLKEYNAKFIKRRLNPENGHRFLPYIVLVIDEFADLIMTAGKEVETPIARLAQLARAIGIHLIIATQRPSVNIITGLIKANFPARIAFRVTSKIDSRTILDAGGADQLIGRGDMLFSTGSDLTRLQCGFVDTPEVENICEFIGSQQGYPTAFHLPEYIDENAGDMGSLSDEDRDELFAEAARVVVSHQQGSASLLQRKLKLGYNRAGRLIDQLEVAGIIGPFKGSKAREVLIQDEMSLEQLLNNGG